MFRFVLALCSTALAGHSFATPNGLSPMDAAQHFRPDVSWRAGSVLTADVDCDGRKDYVLLGAAAHEVVVALFRAGLGKAPDTVAFPIARFEPSFLRLDLERLDVTDAQFKEMLGERPEGYVRSSRCFGLSLGDGERDSVHLYWYKARREFGAWSL
jgi:hypothetical protein